MKLNHIYGFAAGLTVLLCTGCATMPPGMAEKLDQTNRYAKERPIAK